jgi:hypothetical protein
LGAVLVHKAPWVFQGPYPPTLKNQESDLLTWRTGIWKIIKGWLDPVVAAKVHFTNNRKDMEEFIPRSQILKDLEGEEDWEYKYVEPVPGENDMMKDTETRDRLLANRAHLFKEYEEATLQWIQTPTGEEAKEIKERRNAIAAKLREDYWNLDPYVRARSLYDRTGVLLPGGKLQYYPKAVEVNEKEVNGIATNGTQETSADDVD